LGGGGSEGGSRSAAWDSSLKLLLRSGAGPAGRVPASSSVR
jgi:hypothetical protein